MKLNLKNTSSQLYKESDVWRLKVAALQQNVSDFTGVTIVPINDKYDPKYTTDADIVIMAVDDMAVRKTDSWMTYNKNEAYDWLPYGMNVLWVISIHTRLWATIVYEDMV